jgi:TatD DNase family protein
LPTSERPETYAGHTGLKWIDNHCHLDVEHLVCVGVSLDRSRECIRLAEAHPSVSATVGLHPHDATDGTGELSGLAEAGRDLGTVVAVGECGLDYFYEHSPREVQKAVFAEQIGIAHALALPLVIHTRDAWADTFAILDSEGIPEQTVFHCFTGGPEEAEQALQRGAHLSISGIVTFKSATELREATTSAPLERLMVETDSPYLAPTPHRGKKNRPALVARVGEEVAILKGLSVAEVASATSSNARAFYGITPG